MSSLIVGPSGILEVWTLSLPNTSHDVVFRWEIALKVTHNYHTITPDLTKLIESHDSVVVFGTGV